MDALRIISEDHNNLWRLATTVDQLAGEMEAGAPLELAFFTSVLDYIEQFVERSHHPKEDDYLFRLLRLRNPYAEETLDALQTDHRGGLARLQILRESLASTASGSQQAATLAIHLRTYTAGLKKHILTEEKQVMPLARKALLKEDWQEINRAFLDNSDPLFGESAQAEFRELYHRIVSTAPESVGLGAHSAGDLPPRLPWHKPMCCCGCKAWKAVMAASRRSRASAWKCIGAKPWRWWERMAPVKPRFCAPCRACSP
jgi:branched-chain amino acid transport system ATP-binding protein